MWGISFLNPLFLFGLFAAVLPLVIHFFMKSKIQVMPFSFIHIMESVSQKKLQRIKISKILLLLLRILILAVLAFALAKPFFRNYTNVFFSDGKGTSVVILLDNSFSMSMVDTNISRLENAKDAAKEILTYLSERDEAAVITFSNKITADAINFSDNKDFLSAQINKIKVSHYSTNIAVGIRAANKLFRKSKKNKKKIILITDMQKNGWNEVARGAVPPEVKINIINVGKDKNSNIAFKKVIFPKQVIKGQIIRFDVTVKNHGNIEMTNKLLSLVINGQKVNNKQINLNPDEEKKFTLYYTFATHGNHKGYVEVSDDFMPVDNKYYFSLNVINELKILSVNGKYDSKLSKNETFYLNTALNPSQDSETFIKITEIYYKDLNKIEFSDYNIHILANVPELTQIQTGVIEKCVKTGGGLIVALGDKINPENYNKDIFLNGTGLLPGKISYQISSSLEKDNLSNVFNIDKIEITHPLFSVFNKEALDLLKNVPFYSFYRIDVNELSQEVKILAKFNDGLPALIERKYGKGKVLLFSSSLGLYWNQFAVNSIFPAFIHECINYLAVNDNSKLNYFIEDSDFPLKTINADNPGIYEVTEDNNKNYYAVNLNFNESNIKMIEEDEVFNKISSDNLQLTFVKTSKNSSRTGFGIWFKGEIWKILLVLLFVLLIAETLVANRGSEN